MTVVLVFVALLLALLGIGGALSATGHRKGYGLLFWSGIMILTVVLGVVAIEVFFAVVCWAGGGCI
jgi:hypothetical protein